MRELTEKVYCMKYKNTQLEKNTKELKGECKKEIYRRTKLINKNEFMKK